MNKKTTANIITEAKYRKVIKSICDSFDLKGFRDIVENSLYEAGLIETKDNIRYYKLWRQRVLYDLAQNIFDHDWNNRDKRVEEQELKMFPFLSRFRNKK